MYGLIASLSLGFFIGGRIADKRNRRTDLVWLLILASLMAVSTLLTYENVLQSIAETDWDSRWQAVVAAVVLFAPTSYFIGMTSPYLAKLNVSSLTMTGRAVANLDTFNAIGGIAGTFVTGFILFGYIGAHEAISLVAIILLSLSWTIAPRIYIGKRIAVTVILLVCALSPQSAVQGVTKIDTASAHYEVISGFWGYRPVTGLVTGPTGTQSAVYQDKPNDPVFWYVQEAVRLAVERQPKSILVLGGGAFTMPQHLSERLPHSQIDVVEIDPMLEDISQTYFGYTHPNNVTEIFTDARTYTNKTNKTYDMIIVDVYGDTTIPFTFMTKEYGQQLARILVNNGLVVANVIGGETGACRETLTAVDASYRSRLPYVWYATESGHAEERANYIMAYAKYDAKPKGLKRFTDALGRVYTDNFAPAERLYYGCLERGK